MVCGIFPSGDIGTSAPIFTERILFSPFDLRLTAGRPLGLMQVSGRQLCVNTSDQKQPISNLRIEITEQFVLPIPVTR